LGLALEHLAETEKGKACLLIIIFWGPAVKHPGVSLGKTKALAKRFLVIGFFGVVVLFFGGVTFR